MEIKYRLIAEVIKLWRAAPEERALAEALLYMTGLELEEAQKMSVPELADVLSQVIRRPEEKGRRQEEDQGKEPEAELQNQEVEEIFEEETLTQSEPETSQKTQEENQTPELSFIEAKKLKRGRKPNVQGSVN